MRTNYVIFIRKKLDFWNEGNHKLGKVDSMNSKIKILNYKNRNRS